MLNVIMLSVATPFFTKIIVAYKITKWLTAKKVL
jgi:hypothetical protein